MKPRHGWPLELVKTVVAVRTFLISASRARMAALSTGYVTRFRLAIEKCHGHKPQHIRVTRVGNIPKGKRKRHPKPTLAGSNGGNPHADAGSRAH